MIQHPPEPMHPSQRHGGARRDWHEQPAQSSPYGRDRDYEPEPSRVPYSRDQPHYPEWHQERQYGRQDYPPSQFQDWQQGEDWPRGPGYRARDLDREQQREMDDYYAERYSNPEPGYTPRQRPNYRAVPPYRNGAGYPGGAPRAGAAQGENRAYNPRSAQQPGQQGQPGQYSGAGSWNAGGNAARAQQPPARPTVNYRGRAPKGYVRSDERIREDICDRLSEASSVDASDISVSVRNGIVTLEGSIADRQQKHRAEDIADGCSGVKDVCNFLSVPRAGNGNGDGRGMRGDTPRDS